MAKITFPAATVNAMAQALRDKIDAGSAAGKIKFYTAPLDAWVASKAYTLGDAVYENGHVYEVTVAGTSAASEPTWPASGTVSDGGVTWTERATGDTLLGTLTCADPVGSITNGVLTFGAITRDNAADAWGKARRAVISDSDDVVVAEVDVSALTGNGAIKLNTVDIAAGGPIEMSAFSITVA